MKILIINDLYKYGGSEVQTFREQKILQKNNHEVLVVTFDDTIKTGFITNDHYNIRVNRSFFSKAVNRFIINYKIFFYLKMILKKYQPNVIHLNNINFSPFTVLKCCKKNKCFQTIRDYSCVCPKGTCIKNDLNVCKGYRSEKCNLCIKKSIYLKIRLIHLKIFNNYRQKIIVKFICPSQELTEYCNNNGLNTLCINNPFDFSILQNTKIIRNSKQKIFLYYGQLKKEKGIDKFIEAFHFSNLEDAKLLLCGKIEKNLIDYIEQLNYPNIEYIGMYEYKEMLKLVATIDYIVVPSLWLENYPNTVLEGMALSKVVIASNRGGMSSMINNNNLIFDVLNQEDIILKIKYVYNLSAEKYNLIVKRNKKYLINHNEERIFYKDIIKVFTQ